MHISSSTEKFLLEYSNREKSNEGFISANPSLHFNISVIPTSERSPTAVKTPAQGVYVDSSFRHLHAYISFVCTQEKQGISPFCRENT